MKWLNIFPTVATISVLAMALPSNHLEPLNANFPCPVSKLPAFNDTVRAAAVGNLDRVFSFEGFGSNQQRLNAAKIAALEGAHLLYIGLSAITLERNLPIRTPSYRRYFPDNDAALAVVWNVIATMYRQVASIIFPDAHPPCLGDHSPPFPNFLPFKIFNQDPLRPDRCYEGNMAVFSSERLRQSDPTSYIILCGEFFDQNRGRSERTIQCERIGSFMNEFGEGPLLHAEGAGAVFGGAIIVHELLHWRDVTVGRGGPGIFDNFFLPPGFPFQTKAYSPWMCRVLKEQLPQVTISNDNNYIFYMLEMYWTQECHRRGYTLPPWEDPPQSHGDQIPAQPDILTNPNLRPGDIPEFSRDWSVEANPDAIE